MGRGGGFVSPRRGMVALAMAAMAVLVVYVSSGLCSGATLPREDKVRRASTGSQGEPVRRARLKDTIARFVPAHVSLEPLDASHVSAGGRAGAVRFTLTTASEKVLPHLRLVLSPNTQIVRPSVPVAVYSNGVRRNRTFSASTVLHGTHEDGTYVHGYLHSGMRVDDVNHPDSSPPRSPNEAPTSAAATVLSSPIPPSSSSRQPAAWFSGVIHMPNGSHFSIEPARFYADAAVDPREHTHVVYGHHHVREDVLQHPPRFCDAAAYERLRRRHGYPDAAGSADNNDGDAEEGHASDNHMGDGHTGEFRRNFDKHPWRRQRQHEGRQQQPWGREEGNESAGNGEGEPCKGSCTCTVTIIADFTYFQAQGSQENDVIAAMVAHVNEADALFRRTSFGGSYGYGLTVGGVVVYKDASDGPVNGGRYSADSFLEAFTTKVLSGTCLAHVFTHRDFAEGVLGLAWVGGGSAGICSTRGYNSGFTTSLNFGARVSQAVSMITVTHEVGHNWGSPHDETPACAPGQPQGNYIMFPSATDGSLPNNRYFSSCSQDHIASTLSSNGGCFDDSRSFCGNGIVEADEPCDCGDDCVSDPCCTSNCTIPLGLQCSPQDPVRFPCCSQQCLFVPASQQQRCSPPESCQRAAVCDGTAATCPLAANKPNDTLCACLDNDCDAYPQTAAKVCVSGQCSGSICSLYGGEQCRLGGADDCWVACHGDGWGDGSQCVSTNDKTTAKPENFTMPRTLPPNTPCDGFAGYCDHDGNCVSLRNNNLLEELERFLNGLSWRSTWGWIKNNWQWVLLGVGVFIVLVALLVVTKPKMRARRKGRRRGNRSLWHTDQDSSDDDDDDELVPLVSSHSDGDGTTHGATDLSEFPWLHPHMSQAQATKALISAGMQGAFLMRLDSLQRYVLSVWSPPVRHVCISVDSTTGEYFLPTSTRRFRTLAQLVAFYIQGDPEDIIGTALTHPILFGKPPRGARRLFRP